MLYSIVDKNKAEDEGFKAILHQCTEDKMILNENELRKVDSDIEAAAHFLGGVILTNSEIREELKRKEVNNG